MSTIESFRAAPADTSNFLASIPFAADRVVVAEALAEVENERRASKRTLFPLAAANAVVGGALLVFAWGLLARREGARAMTVQLLGAQMALELLEYVLTPGMRAKVLALASAYLDAQVHGAGETVSPALVEAMRAVVYRAPLVMVFAALLGRAFTIAPLLRAEARAYCLAAGAHGEDGAGNDDDRDEGEP